MTVLIVKANKEFFKVAIEELEFKDVTENTCTFEVTETKFNELYEGLKNMGMNPFALMSW